MLVELATPAPPMAAETGSWETLPNARASDSCADALNEISKAATAGTRICLTVFILIILGTYNFTTVRVYSFPPKLTRTLYWPGAQPRMSMTAGSNTLTGPVSS